MKLIYVFTLLLSPMLGIAQSQSHRLEDCRYRAGYTIALSLWCTTSSMGERTL